jgi:8-oxo-dGTP pyrophosphatase MutT (NUDIX family)
MHLADAVNVIAITPDDRVVFVRQFRAGSGRDSLEPPGGLLDEGEDACVAGARELLEETGYAGEPGVLLGMPYSVPSILTSRFAVVVIRNARRVAEPKPDDREEVEVVLVASRDVPRLIRDGAIEHALSVMALLWWFSGPVSKPSRGGFSVRDWLVYAAVLAVVMGALVNVGNPSVGAAFAFGAVGVVVGLALGEIRGPGFGKGSRPRSH